MLRKIAIIAAACLTVGAGAASAQDRTLPPIYGTYKFQPGFIPFVQDLRAGGTVAVDETLGGNCRGYVTDAAALRVSLTTDGTLPLVFSVTSNADTTLVISDPDGNWICDDDSGGGVNPLVTIDRPMPGQYDVWVGTYFAGDFADARLTIEEGDPEGFVEVNVLDWRLDPSHGTYDLAAGFEPDPFTVDLAAGGGLAAADTAEGCYGYTTAAPDIRINYDGFGGPLYFSVRSPADTTLIISDPAGNWICDDDSGGNLDPAITIGDALNGQYDIWIGTYSAGPIVEATFFLSATAPYGSATLNWDLDPQFGQTDLATGFLPDPFWIDVTAGGDVDVANVGSNCWGFAGAEPDYRLFFEAGDYPLTIYAMSEADTVLVIADPDGNWFCNDDTDGLNPAITFDPALDGQYDIWVGTYGAIGEQAATLFITELGGPGDDSGVSGVSGPDTPVGAVDPSLPPIAGTVVLASGFLPDPFTVDLDAGGDLYAGDVDPTCRGDVTAAPTLVFGYEAGAFPLYIWAEATADTTLMILDPAGNWVCDDDGAATPFDPALAFASPLSGDYVIWVGTYAGGAAPATLFISEIIDARADAEPSAPVSGIPPPSVPPVSGPELPDGPIFLDP